MPTAYKRTGVEYSCFDQATAAGGSMVDASDASVVVHVVRSDGLAALSLSEQDRAWMEANGFTEGSAGESIVLPGPNGHVGKVVMILEDACDLWAFSKLRSQVPAGTYRLELHHGADDGDAPPSAHFSWSQAASLGWMLDAYSFDRYKSKSDESKSDKSRSKNKQLVWPSGLGAAERTRLVAMVQGISLARDMVSTPAEEMAPLAASDSRVAALKAMNIVARIASPAVNGFSISVPI